ncbi:hypothetical protein [Mesorhizobium argentiipisi]|uniref:Uncharacterized protein n=1 Tax=Mesorhizobium argentiipisi TaxID=3015175 RepID=A0ABU8KJM6_9HYPH
MTDFVREIISAYVRRVVASLSPEEDVDPDSPETVFKAFAWATACLVRGIDPLAAENSPTLH